MSTNKRLNMEHGFMQCIIKNQIDRDKYEKQVKAAQKPKHPVNQNKGKKPDLVTYIPPKKPKGIDLKTSANDATDKTRLFVFEYEADNGEVHTMDVYKNDDIAMLARQFAQEQRFSESMTLALSAFLKATAREQSHES
ncbi:hypothetical protein LSH36_132g00011 [Paralvinella palmiformis]|uniref:Uncharacterized protein n=1 Tax=Paralvinella palmiformis TaxID=53620 RepID=A0AAD9N9K9_9ANNE|nr:hypothetical protein LSH36_132g00011 [Paralvinella palmiformis]